MRNLRTICEQLLVDDLSMTAAITQLRAKTLIRDYLRATGRKGLTSLMKDINKFSRSRLNPTVEDEPTRKGVFEKRTLEKWLQESARMLQDDNWTLVRGFIESEYFKSVAQYSPVDWQKTRLDTVARGFAALYAGFKQSDVYLLPSAIEAMGRQATELLTGHWELLPSRNVRTRKVPTFCRIEPVKGERYAKFVYISLRTSAKVSATGLIIYVASEQNLEYDYCHSFVLQVWRRRNSVHGSAMPAGLTFLKLADKQPELHISFHINSPYNVKIGLDGVDISQIAYHLAKKKGASSVTLGRSLKPRPEVIGVVDELITDVLPHGLT